MPEFNIPKSDSLNLISGYFIDDGSPFENYLVRGNDENFESEHEDNQIFYYGLDTQAIKKAIKANLSIGGEFIITSYKKYK